MRVALVHDWLNGMRGGEKVLEVLCELYPQADIYTLLYEPKNISPIIRGHRVITSFIQNLPKARQYYRNYLPLFPAAVEQFDLRPYDLVISSSHCVAKGAITQPGTPHICYCHTPMRYAWEQYHEYFPAKSRGRLKSFFISLAISRLRLWDRVSAGRVDAFIANSHHVARRIKKYYGRPSEVVHPPVDAGGFRIGREPGGFYLVVSALVPYKRVDRAIAACNELKLPLTVVGSGPEKKRLERLAGPTVKFLEKTGTEKLVELYAQCRAFIFPGEEDFGITPLEAMASGRPVIAYDKGGVRETVIPGKTGIFFNQPTPASLMEAIQASQNIVWDTEEIRSRAMQFNRSRFKQELADTIKACLEKV
ncbi:glycosyltransferase [bacterium]|nr:glycosyltransferase [bacterium]